MTVSVLETLQNEGLSRTWVYLFISKYDYRFDCEER